MLNVNEEIKTWKRGIKVTAALLLFGVLCPLMMTMLFSTALIIPMFILGFDLEFWDKNLNDITLLAIILFGPHFIGNYFPKDL